MDLKGWSLPPVPLVWASTFLKCDMWFSMDHPGVSFNDSLSTIAHVYTTSICQHFLQEKKAQTLTSLLCNNIAVITKNAKGG